MIHIIQYLLLGLSLYTSSISHRHFTEIIIRGATSGELQWQSPFTASIHMLDDDSLLHVFYLCQPFFWVEDDIAGPFEHWRSNAGWWYTLAHVCQRWRQVILGSATYLGLSLVCTYGTPVADMLAHSPPLPLVVGYFIKDRDLTTEDEEGIILALKQHDRVRHVRLGNPVTIMQDLFVVMDEEYPILQFLYIMRPIEDHTTILKFPGALQAPRLRHLSLQGFALSMGSQLLTTAVGLVTLHLSMMHPSTYFHPNTLIQAILLMPQLETLEIYFEFSILNHDVKRQLTHTSITAPIPLSNLRHFEFHGVSTYLEALVHQITTPRLKKLTIEFFNQLTFSVPRLLQFIDAAGNLRFGNAVLNFSDKYLIAGLYPRGDWGNKVFPLSIVVKCLHLDWEVSSMAQISNSLSQIFSAVKSLFLQHEIHSGSSQEHNDVDRTEWRKLLRPFNNVQTLGIDQALVKDLSRCLQLENGEHPLELLPELHELTYFESSDTSDAFTSFIDARRNAGRPVALVRHYLDEPTLSEAILRSNR